MLFNGEKLKSFDEILPEMAIAQYVNIACNRLIVLERYCVQGAQ